MNEDDDEPVIEEIPLYLSNTLSKKLFVYQYPVRPNYLSYDNTTVLKSSIKPEHQEVRLEMELYTDSPNYDTSKGEQIALNVDGAGTNRKKAEERYFKSTIMDKQVLESTRAVTDASKYAVGVLHDKEFHLTALRGIVHMRPAFNYLDKSDKRAKELAKEIGEGDQSGDEEEEAKQVTVKFARQENERIKRARERSFGYLSKKSAEEPWFHTRYHSSMADRAELERGKLYCSRVDEKPAQLNLATEEYMNDLVPQASEQACTSSALSTTVISLRRLRLFPLLDQVKHLLQEAKLLGFSQLVSLLGRKQDPLAVLRTVQQVAVLVQGNWVVRSDVLYPKDSVSDTCGIPAELMCRGRDYILCMFTQHLYVDRVSVSAVVKLPGDEVKVILSQIARLRGKRGWELQLPFDKDFVSRYPEVVQRQQKIWEVKLKQFNDAYSESDVNRTQHNSLASSNSETGAKKKAASLCRKLDNGSDVEGTPRQNKNCSVLKVAKLNNPLLMTIKEEPMDT